MSKLGLIQKKLLKPKCKLTNDMPLSFMYGTCALHTALQTVMPIFHDVSIFVNSLGN